MRKYEYFIRSLQANADYARDWILRAMSVVLTPPPENLEWGLKHTQDAVLVNVPHVGGGWEWVVLEGAKPFEIAFIYHDASGPVKTGELQNVDRDLENSTWGELLYNHRALCYAAGALIPFRQPVDLKKDEMIFIDNMKSDVLDGEDEPGQLYVKHYQRFGRAIGDLSGYELFIPSLGARALTPPENNKELRDKLFEENKETLDDPVTQVKIQKALVDNYIEKQLKGDPAEGFIYKPKSINTALKRMLLIHGPEAGFSEGGRAELIPNSLAEGIDVKKYPAMVNSLRAGSFYRGALTALAGEDVDLFGRIFQNSRIVKGFCGTLRTMGDVVDEGYMGRTLQVEVEVAGGGTQLTQVTLNKENFDQYNGVYHQIYSPSECITPGTDVCEICMGQRLAPYADSLGSMMGDIPSKMMALMMGSAHAKELKTTPLDVEGFLR